MADDRLEADYVILGAGATGMAFADQLLTDTDASMILIDRRAKPGGHWNDAYSFVRLHGPSLSYGVNSRELGSGQIDKVGVNAGLHELATGPEICAYFDSVLRQRLLPCGRVAFLAMHDYANGIATHQLTGARTPVGFKKKLVDCTNAQTKIPATHAPPFSVADGVRCVALGELVEIKEPVEGFTIIGAGKTAMDAVVWLREQGVAADRIAWVRPREPWILNRRFVQPSFECFEDTIGCLAREFEIAMEAASIEDLLLRLEAETIVFRIDQNLTPTMYHCPIVSEAELAHLRSVKRVIRQGHVQRIEPDRIVSELGETATTANTVHVHCATAGIPRLPARPVFQGDRIDVQYVRRCSPTFSAAVIAHLEAALASDEEKNAAAMPVPIPDTPLDWLRERLQDAENQRAWQKIEGMVEWLAQARLDRFAAMLNEARTNPTPEIVAIGARIQAARKPGLTRLRALLEEAETAVH
ncbi:MAG: FAD/NAD(P)-binding protein [Pseudomonadota bacterium]